MLRRPLFRMFVALALDERSARQLSQEEKAARSTFVVDNDGDVVELEHKLSAILDMLGV